MPDTRLKVDLRGLEGIVDGEDEQELEFSALQRKG